MVDEFAVMSGPLSPDAVRLPGRPVNLKATVQTLTEVINDLKNVSTTYKQASPESPTAGRVLRAVAHVAQVTGQALDSDAEQLQSLCDAVQREADIMGNAQSGQLPELRQRWENARHTLRDAVDEENRKQRQAAARREAAVPVGVGPHGGGGHGGRDDHPNTGGAAAPSNEHQPDIDADDLIHSMEGDAFDNYAQIFRRATGAEFHSPRGKAQAMLLESDGALDTAISQFRQTVHGVFEEYSDVARQVLNADGEIEAKLQRQEQSITRMAPVDPGVSPQVGISTVQEIQKLNDSVRQGNNSLNNLSQRFQAASDSLNQGRLRDHEDDTKHTTGERFTREWDTHFDELRHNVNQALERAGSVAEKLQQIDEQGAQEVRRAGKAEG